jgi:hypothetical protein
MVSPAWRPSGDLRKSETGSQPDAPLANFAARKMLPGEEFSGRYPSPAEISLLSSVGEH